MSTPVALMIADIDRKIANLTELRKNLLQFEIDFPHSAASLVPIEPPAPRRGRKPGPTKRGPYKKKKAAKKAERTNEARRAPVTGGTFDVDHQQQIVTALHRAGASMRSSELQAAVGAPNAPTLNRWVTPLLGKRVVRTGHARGVRYALKEGL